MRMFNIFRPLLDYTNPKDFLQTTNLFSKRDGTAAFHVDIYLIGMNAPYVIKLLCEVFAL